MSSNIYSMENMKYKLELLTKEYENELPIKTIFKHMLNYCCIIMQVKKKFKNML